jgi:hypothetical protein
VLLVLSQELAFVSVIMGRTESIILPRSKRWREIGNGRSKDVRRSVVRSGRGLFVDVLPKAPNQIHRMKKVRHPK